MPTVNTVLCGHARKMIVNRECLAALGCEVVRYAQVHIVRIRSCI
jgi:hypothetical protein